MEKKIIYEGKIKEIEKGIIKITIYEERLSPLLWNWRSCWNW